MSNAETAADSPRGGAEHTAAAKRPGLPSRLLLLPFGLLARLYDWDEEREKRWWAKQ